MGYKIDKEASGRLDALKVLMCIFVLLIHAFSDDHMDLGWQGLGWAYQLTFILSRIVSDCAVPVFILISSVLLYAKPFTFRGNMRKKCRGLLLPYLIFNALWVVLMFCKHLLGEKLGIRAGDDIDFATYSLYDWLDAFLGLGGDHKPILTTLWYVRDLFLLNLLAIPIKKLVELAPVSVLIGALALWVFGISIPGIQDYSLPFFVLGCLAVHWDVHMRDLDRKCPVWLASTAYILLLVAVMLTGRESQLLLRLFLLVSVAFWFRVSGQLCRFRRTVALILPASFFLYLSHRFVYAVLQVLADGSVAVYLLTYVLKPVLALGLLLGVYYLMKRWTPGLLAVLVGGRGRKVRKEAL